jgi:hypothetical protein
MGGGGVATRGALSVAIGAAVVACSVALFFARDSGRRGRGFGVVLVWPAVSGVGLASRVV